MTRWLIAAGAVVVLLGLGVELAHARSHAPAVEVLVGFLSLSYEGNLPTWYASSLLLLCAVQLGLVAGEIPPGGSGRPHWWALAILFGFMSLDEAAEIHEHLGGLVGTGGVLYFDWVIPAAIIVALLGLAFLPFLRALPPRTRNRFILAGALYVGGALLMELPLGWWTERHGPDNPGYALIDWVEESLELAGVTAFLLALIAHRAPRAPEQPA
jgi:hypothetical protein